jgi:TRAP-type C4-dicarboxylate transport system substrate-binding protein
VIDGAEAANTNYLSKKFYEPAHQWTMVGWIHLIETVVMSRYFYERLPQEFKRIIDASASEMIRNERRWYSESEDEALRKLVEEGVKVTTPDRNPFLKASQKVYREWADKVGGMEMIQKIIGFDYGREKNQGENKGRK